MTDTRARDLLPAVVGAVLVALWGWLTWDWWFPVPFWDMVNVLRFLDRIDGAFNPVLFFTFVDNEHRPAFPMVLFYVDTYLLGATGRPLVAASWLCAFVMALVFWRATSERTSDRPWASGLLLLGMLALLFGLVHFENLFWSKQTHVYLSLLASAAAMRLATRDASGACRGIISARAAAVAGLLFVGSFSFLYGLVAWAPVLAFQLLSRRHRADLALTVPAFLLTVALYAATWTWIEGHDSPFRTLLDPPGLMAYALDLVSGPLTMAVSAFLPMERANLIAVTAVVLLTAAGAAGLPPIRGLFGRRRPETAGRGTALPETDSFLLLVMAHMLLIGLVTGLGRLNVTPGETSRYQICGALFLIAAVGLTVRARPATAGAAALGLAAIAAAGSYAACPQANALVFKVENGAMAFALGVDTDPVADQIFPVHQMLADIRERMAAQGIRPWHVPDTDRIGGPLPEAADPARCVGSVESVTGLPGAPQPFRRVVGWALEHRQGSDAAPRLIAFTDGAGRITGLGTVGIRRDEISAQTGLGRLARQVSDAGYPGFIGYVPEDADTGSGVVHAWAILHDGRACPLTGGR
ncbi:hypothetical protein [Rhodospirillum centenum]|uniref:Uncharacterized protein n=1 Tax=Rhodospirillum centenum (strain ATCC 51521 / SW) TaxID=414684 RepID=B6IUQ3_RHOCS|nr:hypothetical protein [Rhodospirillum centenum]ACI99878.1 conserved hypothetical protein [Rhodospirillum centenum SW]